MLFFYLKEVFVLSVWHSQLNKLNTTNAEWFLIKSTHILRKIIYNNNDIGFILYLNLINSQYQVGNLYCTYKLYLKQNLYLWFTIET